jgi:hypothetical protein
MQIPTIPNGSAMLSCYSKRNLEMFNISNWSAISMNMAIYRVDGG